MIRFGAWSTTLGLAAGFGALVAVLLLSSHGNRSANRLLAGLLLVAVLRLMPYVLGFAGFYDVYPWLSFAPFNLALAIGPLLYLYVRRLAEAHLPPRWGWHFAPALVDLAYTLWAFALPLPAKLAWNAHVHERWIDPLESAAALLSLGIYAVLALRFRRRYLDWLAANVSDRDAHRQPWIAAVLGLLCVWLAACVGYEAVDRWVAPLNYYQRFPQYLLLAAMVVWLGLEGWRQAGTALPRMPVLDAAPALAPELTRDSPPDSAAELMPAPAHAPTLQAAQGSAHAPQTVQVPAPAAAPAAPVATPIATSRDWESTARAWHARVVAEGWWREPGLSLAEVARRLGTNESYVSRAYNQGLGNNFNGAINAIRVVAVQHALLDPAAEPAALLTLALDCGFSSKASFNRVFREHAGASPSAWRKAHIMENRKPPASGTTAAHS